MIQLEPIAGEIARLCGAHAQNSATVARNPRRREGRIQGNNGQPFAAGRTVDLDLVCLNGAQYLLSVLCRGRMEVDEQRNLIFADIDEVNADDVVVCTQNLDAVNCSHGYRVTSRFRNLRSPRAFSV